jgi:predicted neuraminidase
MPRSISGIVKSRRAAVALVLALCFPAPLHGQERIVSCDTSHQFDGTFRPSDVEGVEEAYFPTLYPSSHAANLVMLSNGDILCFWFSGSGEGHSNGIVMSRLHKGSQRWSTPIEIDHQEARSFQNPVAFQVPSGRIWLLHTTQVAGQWQTNAEVEYLTSDDEGRTWTKAKTLFSEPGSFVRQPPILLDEKHWLLPMYYTPSRSITDDAASNYSVVKASSDGGNSWKEWKIPQSGGLVQPSIMKLPNGRFLGFFRSRYADFVYKGASEDGCTWTVPAPTPLPNNNSSVQAALLKDGSLMIAFNNSSSGTSRDKPRTAARKPLSIALSTNGGETWPWVRDIETGTSDQENGGRNTHNKSEEYSYPSVLQDAQGQINVAYTYRHETIKVVRFSEDWIKDGSTIGQFKGDQKPE